MTINRIALVLPSLSGGGAERVNLLLAEEFISRGHLVDIVLMRSEGELLDKVPKNVRVVSLNAARFRQSLWALARYLHENKPSAILANMCPLTGVVILAHRIARSKARLVVADHANLSIHYADRGWVQRTILYLSLFAYRLAHGRVAVSTGVAADLARLSRIARSKFEVIYNPIKVLPRNANEEERASALWPKKHGKRILSVGALKGEKNQKLLINAFAKLLKDGDACLMILGEGELRAALESLVEQLEMGDRVVLPGYIDDPSPFYRSADLFVLSSDFEGFGNVIVEAMACGIPVVATDCPGGPSEILDRGRYGDLCPVGDINGLAKTMQLALAKEPNKDALVQRASEFSVSRAADNYLALLLEQQE